MKICMSYCWHTSTHSKSPTEIDIIRMPFLFHGQNMIYFHSARTKCTSFYGYGDFAYSTASFIND